MIERNRDRKDRKNNSYTEVAKTNEKNSESNTPQHNGNVQQENTHEESEENKGLSDDFHRGERKPKSSSQETRSRNADADPNLVPVAPIENSWHQTYHGSNVLIFENQPNLAQRQVAKGSTDGVIGKHGYRSGRHAVRFTFNDKPWGSHCAIGVATKTVTLQCDGYAHLFADNPEAWCWDIPSGQLLHENKAYATLKHDPKLLPRTIDLILDVENGTLLFQVDGEDVIGFQDNCGIKECGRKLYPVVSLVYGMAEVKIETRKSLKRQKSQNAIQRPNPPYNPVDSLDDEPDSRTITRVPRPPGDGDSKSEDKTDSDTTLGDDHKYLDEPNDSYQRMKSPVKVKMKAQSMESGNAQGNGEYKGIVGVSHDEGDMHNDTEYVTEMRNRNGRDSDGRDSDSDTNVKDNAVSSDQETACDSGNAAESKQESDQSAETDSDNDKTERQSRKSTHGRKLKAVSKVKETSTAESDSDVNTDNKQTDTKSDSNAEGDKSREDKKDTKESAQDKNSQDEDDLDRDENNYSYNTYTYPTSSYTSRNTSAVNTEVTELYTPTPAATPGGDIENAATYDDPHEESAASYTANEYVVKEDTELSLGQRTLTFSDYLSSDLAVEDELEEDLDYTEVDELTEEEQVIIQKAHGWDEVNKGGFINLYPGAPNICVPLPSFTDKVQAVRSRASLNRGRHRWLIKELKFYSPGAMPIAEGCETNLSPNNVLIGVATGEQRVFNFGFRLQNIGRNIWVWEHATRFVWHENAVDSYVPSGQEQKVAGSQIMFADDDLDTHSIDLTKGIEVTLDRPAKTLTLSQDSKVIAEIQNVKGKYLYPFVLFNRRAVWPVLIQYLEGPSEHIESILESYKGLPNYKKEDFHNRKTLTRQPSSKQAMMNVESIMGVRYDWGVHSPEIKLHGSEIELSKKASNPDAFYMAVCEKDLRGYRTRHKIQFKSEDLSHLAMGLVCGDMDESESSSHKYGVCSNLGADNQSWVWFVGTGDRMHAGMSLGAYPDKIQDLDLADFDTITMIMDFCSTRYNTVSFNLSHSQTKRSYEMGMAFVSLPDRVRPFVALKGTAIHRVKLEYASGPESFMNYVNSSKTCNIL